MTPILIAILLVIIGYKFYEFITSVPPNTPPWSYWHLLWGNYEYPHKTVRYYVKQFNSKLVSCYLGEYLAVIANDYKTIKEVMNREDFDGRPSDVDVVKARAFGKKLGIFFTEGLFWHEQRRFTLRNMRDFGFGRRQDKFENHMVEEAILLIDMIKEGPINDHEKIYLKKGYALFPDILYPYFANSIWEIMFGERFNRSEHYKLWNLCEAAMLFQRSIDTTGGAIFQRPFLKYFGNLFRYTDIIKGNTKMVNFIQEHLEELKRTHNTDSDRGLIDRYLEEMKKHSEMSTFSEQQLIMSVLDFMFPALSALPSALTHAIKFTMHNPDVVKRVHEEIDRVVGTGRHVTWQDRQNLPYTEATVRESLRRETLTPFGVIHKALKDTTLGGYDIPKNTLVIANLGGLNEDPDFWGDPENFRPERFLTENNELGKDFTLPFGFGHRVCAGETFARYNMFGLFALLMQNFNLTFVEGEPTGINDKISGLIVMPKKTWIRMEPRG
ncbi:putative cytochrome P450 304a1 isoform X2 [Calliopsis andreniformis]|uniref:putative cytochrome P450 304a1 isoform X2 n=1 Tax=Calliopsis andreniformis TaxID=337506 RepID=UPI003FCC9C03